MLRYCFLANILFFYSNIFAYEQTNDCLSVEKQYRLTLRHIESGGIGYDDGYTTLDMFLAADPDKWSILPLFSGRGHIFNDGKIAANLGVGLRTLLSDRVYGINAFYDFRSVSHLPANQIGLGLETIGTFFDFRLNGYLPVGKKTSSPYDTSFADFSGHYMYLDQKYQSAMKGFNAEVGFHLGKTKLFDFYAAAGPYYFIGKLDPATWGGKARIFGTFKDVMTFELSDSYDKTFHNKFQGQISINLFFGPHSKSKSIRPVCKPINKFYNQFLQSVDRQEIIVVNEPVIQEIAIDPSTGLPYFFVFVDNTSNSEGTFESPYHSFAQAQANSSPNDIIYVFPGDGTSTGMDSGIILKANQKLWGSGITHSILTSEGSVSIPAQTSSYPKITNTNADTEGNAITLATNNSISGVILTSALNDAIYGTDSQDLNISFCVFEDITTYPIEAIFSDQASITITNNQFQNNSNGVILTLNGPSSITCSSNTFKNQTSVSSVPIEIVANSNTFTSQIENNLFDANETGSIRYSLNNVTNAEINIQNNTMTNNTSGAQDSLGSNCVILSTGVINQCSINLNHNTISNNSRHYLYMHTDGEFSNLEVNASGNTISNNGSSAFSFLTPSDAFTFNLSNNSIADLNDNAILVNCSSGSSVGTVNIRNNTISNIRGAANGIAFSNNYVNLDITIINNTIDGCNGNGIMAYFDPNVHDLVLDISGNSISNCENASANAASAIVIEQYINLSGSIENNTLSDNVGTSLVVASNLVNPDVCLSFTGNSNDTNYTLTNPDDGTFNLSPCDVESLNSGTIILNGTITLVQSCDDPTPCPP
jgi:hypothetical protein